MKQRIILGLAMVWAVQLAAGQEYEPGGMWMPDQIATVHAETLKKMGLEIDPAAFGDLLRLPLSGIVSLGGGSASFVSPEGLVVTNHHCVRSYLQYNSAEGRNLLREGYIARSREEELPGGPTARVYVTQAVTEVTTGVLGGLGEIRDDLARFKALERRKKEMVQQDEAAHPGTRCEVVDFYGGSRYYLIRRLEIRDVRLVWAPHDRIGDFGGEVDNWMWPRQCGDFSLLRAYVAPDGKPADYSKANVPYKSRDYFRLAQQGIKAGELAMVIGYPGKTYRLATANETREMLEWAYPRANELAQKQVDRLNEIAKGNEDLTIKAEATVAGLENYLKKRLGVLEAAQAGGLLKVKEAEEKRLAEWIAASPGRAQEYGGVVESIDELLKARWKTREADLVFQNILGGSTLLSAAVTIARMAEERPKPDLEREPGYQKRDWQRLEQAQQRAQKVYARAIEQGTLELFLGEAAKLPESGRPAILAEILGGTPATPEAIKSKVSELLDKTKLAELDRRLELLREADTAALKASTDPMVRLGLKALETVKANEEKDKRLSGALIFLTPRFFAALSRMNGGRVAPDANGTIRVTFGTVRGFRPAAGRPEYFPFTNVWEMAEKWARNKGAVPFDAPAKIITEVAENRFGSYAEAEAGAGAVPIDFLTDCDVTNGNSGSPTLNARGEFTGILFDGNIEGVAGDMVYQKEVKRAVHADVRYLKWLLDAVDGGGHLLREMGVEPVFAK